VVAFGLWRERGRGVVVLVRPPRDKARPAVVVRSDLRAELAYATVLPITTELRADISMRIDVDPSAENGLRERSLVMVDWPQTVRAVDMGAAIGQLDAVTMQAVTQQMAVLLGIGCRTGRRLIPGLGMHDPSVMAGPVPAIHAFPCCER
jgi:mRNA interferase MazF